MARRRVLSRAQLILLLVLAAALAAQNRSTEEQGVLVAYRQMEEADRHGDGRLWFSLRDRKTLDSMHARVREMILKGGRPAIGQIRRAGRKSSRHPSRSCRQSDRRAKRHHSVRHSPVQGRRQPLESCQGTVERQALGSFCSVSLVSTGGRRISARRLALERDPVRHTKPPCTGKSEMPWKVQATMDESFLYLRFEANAPLLAPGAKFGTAGRQNGHDRRPAASPTHAHQDFAVRGAASHRSGIRCLRD